MHAPLVTMIVRIVLFACAVLAMPRAAASDHARFGERVALETQTLLVGAPEEDGSGRLHVFALDAGVWRLRQRIDSDVPCAGCGFAASVAIDGPLMAIGEPGSGSVFVFRFEQGVWRREARLRDAENPALGRAVAVSGGSVVAGSGDGRPATVFVRDPESVEPRWLLQARLAPGGEHARFGSAIAIDGDLVAVGDPAPRAAGGGRGTIHVFERDDDAWGAAALVAQADNAGDGFGNALALHGDTLLAGVEVARRAQVYTRDGSRWSRTAILQPIHGGDSQFGAAVGLSPMPGSTDRLQAIVGAPLAANGLRREAGLAQIHRGRAAEWDAGTVLQPGDERDAHAGWDVAVSDEVAALGIPDLDRGGVDRGGVATYLDADASWQLSATLDAQAEAPDDAPVIDEVDELTFNEGQTASLRIPIDDPDTALDELVVVVQSTDPEVLDDGEIAVRAALGGRRVDLDPDPDAHGSVALSVLAGDGRSVATRRIPVQIRPVNDAPDFALAASPVFAPRPGSTPRLLAGFVRDFDPGPRESEQTIAAGELQETSDPAGAVDQAALIASSGGRGMDLSLTLSGRAGTAQFDVRIRDSGGSANGGEEWSAVRRFTVTVQGDPSTVFFDGFE